MKCPNCNNNNINTNDKFCTNCGTKLDEIKESQEETKHNNNDFNNSSGDNTISLVLGIISCITSFIPIISLPLAIASLILGVNYKKETNSKSSGLILGIIGTVLTIIFIIIYMTIFIFIIDTINDEYNEHYDFPITERYYNDIVDHF